MAQTHIEFALPDAAATELLGAGLGRAYATGLHATAVLYLHGELGAGKTTCVRSLLRSLGVAGLIRSPTYTLVEVYQPEGLQCVHVDLYRLRGPLDVEELGLRDFLQSPCLLMVEWPERGIAALPPPDVELTLTYSGEQRRATLTAPSPQGQSWLSMLRQDTSLTSYVSNLT